VRWLVQKMRYIGNTTEMPKKVSSGHGITIKSHHYGAKYDE